MYSSSSSGFSHQLVARPDFALLTVQVPSGQTIRVEASAMAFMDSNMEMKTKFKGGFKRMLSGESLFINEFTAKGSSGEISISPGAPGDMTHVYLNNETIFLQNTAFVASHPDITLDTKWQGLRKGFFSGESFFLIKCSGTGDLWFNTFGALIELDDVDSALTVDTGHIVAFTEGLEYSVSRIGGYKSLFFSGEGLVCRFKGHGKVWIQTRKVNQFASWLHWFRPLPKKNSLSVLDSD